MNNLRKMLKVGVEEVGVKFDAGIVDEDILAFVPVSPRGYTIGGREETPQLSHILRFSPYQQS
jgi:hypothetical protein